MNKHQRVVYDELLKLHATYEYPSPTVILGHMHERTIYKGHEQLTHSFYTLTTKEEAQVIAQYLKEFL